MTRAFLLALTKLPLFLAGLVIVAVMIPFRKTDEATRLPNGWVFTNFGTWWGNPFDGLMGDKRLDYAKGFKAFPTFWSMWLWAAVRNPVNYWSRLVAGVDVSRCTIHKVWGDDTVVEAPGVRAAQYIVAKRDDGREFPRLFVVLPWFFKPTHALLIDLGWKVKLSHNGTSPNARLQDRFKGLVFTVSPWKTLS